MSDSQRPKPAPLAPSFEVPDLEHEPASGSARQSARHALNRTAPAQPAPSRGDGTFDSFDSFGEEGFRGSLSLDLDDAPRIHAPVFGSSLSFEDPNSLELEPTRGTGLSLDERPERAAKVGDRGEPEGARAAWPTGRALDVARLVLDPVEIAVLADYGDVPQAVQLTPAYAYRVFMRQRELKRQLRSIVAEGERAQRERESALAELASTVRPAAQKVEQFRRLFAPLLELEQLAGERGRALSAINQQLSAHSGQFERELSQLAEQITAQLRLEQDAICTYDERDAIAQRAEAKLKRVHIEIRAVTQVAEQKLGPTGGEIPEPEASQLGALRQRIEDAQPEVMRTQSELAQAGSELAQVRAQLDALRQSERLATRKKKAVGDQYRRELHLRSQGLSDSERQQRAALADLGRAVLAAAGTVEVSEAWLERVRVVSERADALSKRHELQVRAVDGYDHARVRQGVQLACTVVALVASLILFKLIF